jgi:hypothetical protein
MNLYIPAVAAFVDNVQMCAPVSHDSHDVAFWKKFTLAALIGILRSYVAISKPLFVKTMPKFLLGEAIGAAALGAAFELSAAIHRDFIALPELLAAFTNGRIVRGDGLLAKLQVPCDPHLSAAVESLVEPTSRSRLCLPCKKRGRKLKCRRRACGVDAPRFPDEDGAGCDVEMISA